MRFFCSLSVFAVSTRYIFVERTFSYRFGTLMSLKLGLDLSDYGSYFQKVNRYQRMHTAHALLLDKRVGYRQALPIALHLVIKGD